MTKDNNSSNQFATCQGCITPVTCEGDRLCLTTHRTSNQELIHDLIRLAWACEDCGGCGTVWIPSATTCGTCAPLRKVTLKHRIGISPIMDINAKPGAKIVFSNGLNGYSGDQKQCRDKLKLGETYTVKCVDAHDCSSTVTLEEVAGRFNTVMFSDASPPAETPAPHPDTVRLDWLQAWPDKFANIDRITSVRSLFNGFATLREAIDNEAVFRPVQKASGDICPSCGAARGADGVRDHKPGCAFSPVIEAYGSPEKASDPLAAVRWICPNCKTINSVTVHHTSCPVCATLRPDPESGQPALEKCNNCNGRGTITRHSAGGYDQTKYCDRCGGSGVKKPG